MDTHLEHRRAIRRHTMIEAQIVFNGGRTRIDSIIRNLSDSGAKLEVAASVKDIPNTFDLIVPQQDPQACRVAWRSLRELGVEFSGRT